MEKVIKEQRQNEVLDELAIKVSNISKTYHSNPHGSKSIRDFFLRSKHQIDITKGRKKVIKDISFEVKKGEIFGIIGRNGSGKSTLINILMGSIKSDRGGKVITHGKKMRLALGMGVDPNLSARDNIYVNGSILGLSFRYIGEILDDIVDFAGLRDHLDIPVKVYSRGMKQRLIFSIAMYAQADIFLLDEFFGGVGDEEFKTKSDRAFEEQILKGKTIVIVSHSMKIISKMCQRAAWLEKGVFKMMGPTDEVVKAYRESFKVKKG